jgi:hypothetical protein
MLFEQLFLSCHQVKIGGDKQGDARAFEGRVSCVHIYDKALTQAQVQGVKNKCFEKNGKYIHALFF